MWWWNHNQPHHISLSHLTWNLVHIWSHSQHHHPAIKKNTQSLSLERKKGNSKTSPVLSQLELVHLYHVWVVWWSLQKAPSNHNIIHPHSWFTRVLTCYFCMYDPTPWALPPHITPYLEEWKMLHHVDKLSTTLPNKEHHISPCPL